MGHLQCTLRSPERSTRALLDSTENKCGNRTFPGPVPDHLDSSLWWDRWGRTPGCGAKTLYKVVQDSMVMRPALCGMWSCELCGPQRYAWFVAECERNMVDHELRYFWTFTLRWTPGAELGSFSRLTRCWAAFRVRCKDAGIKFSFIWCVEGTQRGMAHMHWFTGARLNWFWVRSAWRAVTGDSFVVLVKRVGDWSVASYVAKYCVKEHRRRRVNLVGEAPRGHLFGKSRSIRFGRYRAVGGKGWEVSQMPYAEAVRHAVAEGELISGAETARKGCSVRIKADRLGSIPLWSTPLGPIVRQV
jgi:hypothetical protein